MITVHFSSYGEWSPCVRCGRGRHLLKLKSRKMHTHCFGGCTYSGSRKAQVNPYNNTLYKLSTPACRKFLLLQIPCYDNAYLKTAYLMMPMTIFYSNFFLNKTASIFFQVCLASVHDLKMNIRFIIIFCGLLCLFILYVATTNSISF